MTTYATLYVNPWPKREEEPAQSSIQAQLIACRAYAVAHGYPVQGVFANLEGGRNCRHNTAAGLLEQVQNGPAAAHMKGQTNDLVVVVYEGRQLLDEHGKPDPIGRLIAAYGVRVESALPPHSVPEVNSYFKPEAVQVASKAMRDLLGVRTHAPIIKPSAAYVDDVDDAEPVREYVWRSLLDLLGDDQWLRRQICTQRASGSSRRELWLQALEGAQRAEAETETRRIKLLDLLLDEIINKQVLACRRAEMDGRLYALRCQRQQAHAFLAAPSLSPAAEELVVEIARCLVPVLEGLDPNERQRAAQYLQVNADPQDDGTMQVACLLPLVDESQRETAVWTVRKEQGQAVQMLIVPPAGGPDAAAEDYPLAWTISQATAAASAGQTIRAGVAV